MKNDDWLDRWQPLISERSNGEQLLEIGCGWGQDTSLLIQAGNDVLAIDKADLSKAKADAPKATYKQIDLRDFFPVKSDSYGVIVASLSLHYFAWPETERLISDIYQSLTEKGILLFRANSTEDVNFGAVGFPKIDHNFYQVEDRTKRFFDQADLKRLFDKRWRMISQEKMIINRFDRDKSVWELVLEKQV